MQLRLSVRCLSISQSLNLSSSCFFRWKSFKWLGSAARTVFSSSTRTRESTASSKTQLGITKKIFKHWIRDKTTYETDGILQKRIIYVKNNINFVTNKELQKILKSTASASNFSHRFEVHQHRYHWVRLFKLWTWRNGNGRARTSEESNDLQARFVKLVQTLPQSIAFTK